MAAAEYAAPVGRAGGRFYRPELDGLRFFAFLAVYVEHTVGFGSGGSHRHLPNWLGDLLGTIGVAGNFGVDLFFVLSAYLITELLLREVALRGELEVGTFYVRRMLRIWPLYFFVLGLAYGLSFVDRAEHMDGLHLAGFLLFVGNWVYFLVPVATVAGPLWSVSLEEQFYLVWPWVVRRLPPRAIARCALGLMAVAMAGRLALNLWRPEMDWVTKNSFTRVDGIAVGVLIAIGLGGGVPRWSGLRRAGVLCASLLVLGVVARAFGLFQRPVGSLELVFGWPLAALACGGVLLAAMGSEGVLGSLLRQRVVVYLGRISFGLYAYHEILLHLGDALFPLHDAVAAQMLAYWCFGLAGTLPVAIASYELLERPFLRLKRRRFSMVESRPD